MQLLYTAVSLIGGTALLILARISRKSDTMALFDKRFFSLSIGAVLVVMAAELMTVFFEGPASPHRIPHIVGNLLGFSISPFIPLLIACTIDGSRKRQLLLFGVPAALNVVLTALSTCFPLVFWVNEQNLYLRGRAFGLYIVSYVAALFCLLLQTLNHTKAYQNSSRSIPIVLFVFVVIGTAGQVLAPPVHITWLCVSFSIILYYVYYCELSRQIDGLTGLLNRRTYEYHLCEIRHAANAAVLLFDIDDFKDVNDLYGHPFGDHSLIVIAACIKKVFFKTGLCFRIGGDEFCVLSRSADLPAIAGAQRRFLHEIELLRHSDPRLPQVSVGYALTDRRSPDIADAVLRADQNMYRFKRRKKQSSPS